MTTKEEAINIFSELNSGHRDRINFWINYCAKKYEIITRRPDHNHVLIFENINKSVNDDYVVLAAGGIQFFKNKLHHRLDGPAIISFLYDPPSGWFINGKRIAYKVDKTKGSMGKWDGELADWANENDIDLENLSEEDKTLIKMVWS